MQFAEQFPDESVVMALGQRLSWSHFLALLPLKSAEAKSFYARYAAEERMLTPQQMAQRLNMSRTTILRKIAAGEINAVKVGNRHRIPYTEFIRFRESRWNQMMALVAPDIEAELFDED